VSCAYAAISTAVNAPAARNTEKKTVPASFRDCGERGSRFFVEIWRSRTLLVLYSSQQSIFSPLSDFASQKARALVITCVCVYTWMLFSHIQMRMRWDGALSPRSKRASHVHLPSALSGYATRILIRFLSHTLVFMSVVFLAAGIPSG